MTARRCLACEAENCLVVIRQNDKILQCNNCGAIQIENEIIVKPLLADRSSNLPFHERLRYRLTYVQASKLIASWYIKYLKTKTDFNFQSVLDVGAHLGILVKKFNDLGIDAYGIEYNKSYQGFAVTDKIEWAFFDTNYKPKRKYDLICFLQNIYYFRDNYVILNYAKKMLNAGGLIFIETTNPLSSIFKKVVPMMNPAGANMILSKKNYESIYQKIGLELIDYTAYRSDYYTDAYTSKHVKLSLAKYFLRLKKPFEPDRDGNCVLLLLKNK
jgi:2-polyprenyl-3-methyl-5-hydroxy-6-metoxy-1,4-benzoquinol methylase